jgi:hypothetical protein
MTQIKASWETYQKANCWRVLRGGKWTVSMGKPDTTGGATRVEMVKVKDHLSFPKYLEAVNA